VGNNSGHEPWGEWGTRVRYAVPRYTSRRCSQGCLAALPSPPSALSASTGPSLHTGHHCPWVSTAYGPLGPPLAIPLTEGCSEPLPGEGSSVPTAHWWGQLPLPSPPALLPGTPRVLKGCQSPVTGQAAG